MKKIAVRNLRLCTKDCLCLYVCPTGASDTENSIIDTDKCTGCGACADACPSRAISLVPLSYPPQQKKDEKALSRSRIQIRMKAEEEKIAEQIASEADNDALCRLMSAVSKSARLVNEDLLRESGYMLPQSGNAHKILKELVDNPPSDDFPLETAKELLRRIPVNDSPDAEEEGKKMRKNRCKMCGHVFDAADGEAPVCPMCGASGDNVELIE